MVVLGITITVAVVGWKRTATTCPPGTKCEKCSDGKLTLTRVPRRSRWLRALGYVALIAPVGLGGPAFMESLRVVRSESSGYPIAVLSIAIQGFISVPFLILGAFLAFPFRESIWRCTSCDHILGQPVGTPELEQTSEQTTGRTCIHCGKEILESAIACPHCWKEQKPLRRAATQGKADRRFTLGFDLVLPLVLIVGSLLYWWL